MTAVIIAGGQSRRMKCDKAFLELGEKMLIQRVLDVLIPLFPSIIINSNTPDAFRDWDYPVISDVSPGKGALGGIYTALLHGQTEYVFCVACDMPLLQPDFIRFMRDSLEGEDALVPRTPDGCHPLHAIYSRHCAPAIEDLFRDDQLKISHLFSLVHTRYVDEQTIRQFDPDLESFLNINTSEEFLLARKIVEDENRAAYNRPSVEQSTRGHDKTGFRPRFNTPRANGEHDA